MLLTTLTFVHVIIGFVGIVSGCVVAHGLLTARRLDGWTALFLTTTAATSVSGFLFPFERFLPSHAVGIVSLLVLPVTIYALYRLRLAGRWRAVYAVTAMLALYLNAFVLVAQAFLKVPSLKALAPTGSEPPFAVTQLVVLLLFIVLTVIATMRFRIDPLRVAALSVQPA